MIFSFVNFGWLIWKLIAFFDNSHTQIAQMSKQRLNKKDGIAPVATGNWGCGSTSHGDVQLKLVIQWMAASLAGLPVLVYYTSGHDKLTKVQNE